VTLISGCFSSSQLLTLLNSSLRFSSRISLLYRFKELWLIRYIIIVDPSQTAASSSPNNHDNEATKRGTCEGHRRVHATGNTASGSTPSWLSSYLPQTLTPFSRTFWHVCLQHLHPRDLRLPFFPSSHLSSGKGYRSYPPPAQAMIIGCDYYVGITTKQSG
jgi:hypothetical protein